MAGEAKTSTFMLGTATVMLGPVADLFDLNPDAHSIGLVKNFRITAEPTYTELTQGVKNQIVYSVMTGNTVRAVMEAYEYTSKNLAYSLGLEGSALAPQTVNTTLASQAAAAATSFSVVAETGFAIGDWVLAIDGNNDKVTTRQLSAVSAGTLTFVDPLAVSVANGSVVRKAHAIAVGSKDDQPFLSAKIVGKIADGTQIVVLCPKIRIINGFSLGFVTENFDNMPLEFTFYDSVSTDPFYTQFANEQAKLITTK